MRVIAGSIPGGVTGIFHWLNPSGPTYSPGFDSASNRNEHQEYFLADKGGRCVGLTTLPPSCAECLEIWEPQPSGALGGLSRPVQGLLSLSVSRDLSYSSFLLTYSLTPWSRVLHEKLTSSQLVKKFPAFYGSRRFITAFTSARHLSLSWTSWIQSIPPHPTYWRSSLILSSIYAWVSQVVSFLEVSPPKTCICLILLDLIDSVITGNWNKLRIIW